MSGSPVFPVFKSVAVPAVSTTIQLSLLVGFPCCAVRRPVIVRFLVIFYLDPVGGTPFSGPFRGRFKWIEERRVFQAIMKTPELPIETPALGHEVFAARLYLSALGQLRSHRK